MQAMTKTDAAAPPPEESPGGTAPVRILVIDDTQANLEICRHILRDAGMQSLLADAGPAGLTLARQSPPPDLILLDIMMPEMDGFAVLRELQADPGTRDIPVFFLTALDDPRSHEAGLRAGAIDYIQKPFNVGALVARIRTQLALKATRDHLIDERRGLQATIEHHARTSQRLERQLQLALESSGFTIWRYAHIAGEFQFTGNLAHLLGYDWQHLPAPDYLDLVHPEDLPLARRSIDPDATSEHSLLVVEYRVRHRDGDWRWVEARSRTLLGHAPDDEPATLGTLNDITERKAQAALLEANLAAQQLLNKKLEEAHNQLLQSEKMASIGQLSAGIAHELNNPIGFVSSNLGSLENYLHDLMKIIQAFQAAAATGGEQVPALAAAASVAREHDLEFLEEDIFELLRESRDGLNRLRKIVQDLKTFSRTGEQDWQEADLQQGLDSTLNIVWNELKYHCTVKKEYAPIPPVSCVISQLNQVFMNLLVNAGQAIETRGEIIIRTFSPDAAHVCVEIEDNGKGIPPEHLNRIFEPFFTTKPVGKGTGLGLSVSYGIIERHRGRIDVSSEPGRGSCFRITLPIHQGGDRVPDTGNAS